PRIDADDRVRDVARSDDRPRQPSWPPEGKALAPTESQARRGSPLEAARKAPRVRRRLHRRWPEAARRSDLQIRWRDRPPREPALSSGRGEKRSGVRKKPRVARGTV